MQEVSNNQFRVGGKLVTCEKPLVMGIVNLTPDSFFVGSRAESERDIAQQVEKHLSEGADILDFGAYSTRPGALDISLAEELRRFEQLTAVVKSLNGIVPVSIDTFRSEVVSTMYDRVGDFIVNDISAGHLDAEMYRTVAKLHLTYIGMHMRGTPQTMQKCTHYVSLVDEIVLYFSKLIEELKILDVPDLIIDPGFGFSKTLAHNYELLAQLDRLSVLNRPVLVGLSRKSMIYRLLEIDPSDALAGTISLNTIALLRGANLLRVHDVKEAKQVVALVEQMA